MVSETELERRYQKARKGSKQAVAKAAVKAAKMGKPMKIDPTYLGYSTRDASDPRTSKKKKSAARKIRDKLGF